MKNQWQGHENHSIRINVFTICIEVRAELMIPKLKAIMVGIEVFLQQRKTQSRKKEIRPTDDENHKADLSLKVVSEEKNEIKETSSYQRYKRKNFLRRKKRLCKQTAVVNSSQEKFTGKAVKKSRPRHTPKNKIK